MRPSHRTLLAAALGAVLLPVVPVAAAPPAPTAVVATLDTGINPYHAAFRDTSPLAYKHPSTYLPGYPKDAVALRLTLGTKDYEEAFAADCARIWEKVQPRKLYWFPGTKIIGGISFDTIKTSCADREAPIVDSGSHGTMTGSRAVANRYGACPTCRLVAVQGGLIANRRQDMLDAMAWMTANASWIDAQSHSWGPFVPAWVPTTAGNQLFTASPDLVRAVEAGARKHLSFWASGNGAAFRLGAAGHPTIVNPTSTPSAISVGGHDSGQMTVWPGFPPHVVSDACASWAAQPGTTTGENDSVGSGTSAATPFVAGGAAAILTEARRVLGDRRTGIRNGVAASGRRGAVKSGPLADGVFTLAEWREVVLKTATRRPVKQFEDGPACLAPPYNATPVAWKDVPDGFPEYLNIGYGAVDRPSVELAKAVLRGRKPMPDRAATDEYFATHSSVVGALHPVWSTGS